MKLSHKIRLSPTSAQEAYLRRACGTSRFVYNWALAEWTRQYQSGGKPSAYELKKTFNAVKRRDYSWALEVTKTACEHAFIDLERAFQNFFAKRAKHPTWKKRGQHDSFYISADQFKLSDRGLWIPKLGWVKMTEKLRFAGKILSATVSRTADRWFVALAVDMPAPTTSDNQAVVGVDLGITTLATLSTGEKITPPKVFVKFERRIKRAQQKLSRKEKGSRNQAKARTRLSRLHYRVKCARDDFAHKLTTRLVRNFGVIVVEDLNVSGMLKNHCLAKAIADKAWSEIRRQLTYKCANHSRELDVVDRWFPSSKACSGCGCVKDKMPLGDRTYTCEHCGLVIDRDINAAINLENTRGLRGINACGDLISPPNTRLNRRSRNEQGQQLCPSS